MTTFSTGGSAVTFTTSGSAVSFAVTPASNAFTTSAVLTPGAHASTHGAGGADPITTLGTVTTTLGTVTTLVASTATLSAGTATNLRLNTPTIGTATITGGTVTNATLVTPTIGTATATGGTFTNATLVTPTIGTATITGGTATTLTAAGEIHTGQAIFAAGSAAGPSIAFTGDTNTGIYSPGADQVGIATAGTARVIVDGSGNVGLGIAPTTLLHAESDSNAVLKFVRNSTDTAAPLFQFFKRRGTSASPTIVANGDTIGQIDFYAYDGVTNRQTAAITSNVDAAPASGDMPSRLNFWTTPDGGVSITERMRIDNAGLITGTGTSLGAWTSYTPTLGGTGWAIGNGTAAGVYCRIGKVVHFRAAIRFGTTSTYGGGSARVSIPLAANNTEIGVFTVMYNDASAGTYYDGVTRYVDANTLFCQYAGASGLFTSTSSTAPFSWVDSDAIFISGTYETSA